MKILILLLPLFSFAYADDTLTIVSQKEIYTSGEHLLVYGNATENESLLLRLVAPDGSIVKFDQIQATTNGDYLHILLSWPESSIQFPFGTYLAEVISTTRTGVADSINIQFSSESTQTISVSKQINTVVYAPETTAVNSTIRVFVQTTSDGQLLGHKPSMLLKTSHVHLPNGALLPLTDSLKLQHEGLFYVDYTPSSTGTFVFHIVAYDHGIVSHGSAATVVLEQDITDISKQVDLLNTVLSNASRDLQTLESEIQRFSTVQNNAQNIIEDTIDSMTNSVGNIESASLQVSSLLFPVSALIAISIALQIVIIAKRS